MRRYLILVAAVLMQMCLGATYSWAVFVRPLKEMTGLLQGTLQTPFSVFYFVFPLTLIFSDRILRWWGPQKASLIGAILFGGGWILASQGLRHFSFIILGIGGLSGVGVGIVYLVPVTVGLAWFPNHKGLVTGITVAGFGGGAALFSQIAGWGMMKGGISPYTMFFLLGISYMITIGFCGLTMIQPPHVNLGEKLPIYYGKILKSRLFQALCFAMLTGLAAGLTVNANMKELDPAATIRTGILAVAFFSVANAIGRVVWGFVFDRVAPERAIQANLTAQALVLLSHPVFLDSSNGVIFFAFLTGFNYGGILVLYASTIARVWGIERVSQVYGLLFSVHLIATFSPMMAGYAYDFTGSFTLPFIVLAAFLLTATGMVQWNRSSFAVSYSPAGHG